MKGRQIINRNKVAEVVAKSTIQDISEHVNKVFNAISIDEVLENIVDDLEQLIENDPSLLLDTVELDNQAFKMVKHEFIRLIGMFDYP